MICVATGILLAAALVELVPMPVAAAGIAMAGARWRHDVAAVGPVWVAALVLVLVQWQTGRDLVGFALGTTVVALLGLEAGELLDDLRPQGVGVGAVLDQDLLGEAVLTAVQREQQVLGADVVVMELQ